MTLVLLALSLAPLSLVSFGGILVVLPEIHRTAVAVNGWVTERQFADLFGLSQASPGPNLMVVSAIGWWIAGVPGAVVALGALVIPSAVLAYGVAGILARFREAPWRAPIEQGIAPLAIGLVCASAFVLARGADDSATALVITVVSAALMFRTQTQPAPAARRRGALRRLRSRLRSGPQPRLTRCPALPRHGRSSHDPRTRTFGARHVLSGPGPRASPAPCDRRG